MMTLTIGTRIIAACAAVIVVSVSAFAVYFDVRQQREIAAALQEKVDESGALAAESLTNWLEQTVGLIENLRDNVAVAESQDAVLQLVGQPTMTERFVYSYYGDRDGNYMIRPEWTLPEGYDPRVRPWYKAAVQAGDTTITEPYVDPTNNQLTVSVVSPVGAGAALRGVVGVDIGMTRMVDMLKHADLGGIGHAFLVNGDGLVLIHSDDAAVMKSLREVFPGSDIAPTDGSTLQIVGDNDLVAFLPVKAPGVTWYLGLAIDHDAAYASLIGFRISFAIITVLLLFSIIGLVGFLIHRLVSQPVNAMTNVMGELSSGNLEVVVPYDGRRDEIGRMAASVRHFREQTVRVRQMEQEKVEDALRSEKNRKAALGKLVSSLEATVGEVARELTGAAVSMQRSATDMAAVAQRTSSQATTVSAAAEEASVNVQTVASAADELSASSADIGRQVAVSREIAAQADREAKTSSQAVEALSEDVARIGDVINLINDIASQTNLLAL
ncbi:MAG: methyl-accepting chemotaxis protein, partial [Caenispirillum sp.]|nr:methyl-accepting chemotaxis protein [Caenispirillum sp.]